MSPLSKVYRCIVYTYSFAAKVEEISETDIDEWHETPDVKWALETCVSSYHKKGG